MAASEARPLISTVLLCWNRLPLSRRVLDAYLSTVSVPHELLVVNNGSTDGTAEWAEGLRTAPGVHDVIQRARNDPAEALNDALSRCRGSIYHTLENDHLCLPGWDEYVLDRFERLPELGQLGMGMGRPADRSEHYRSLVVEARSNVLTSSWFRSSIFHAGVRFRKGRRTFPDDGDFSAQVRRAGYLVAWADREVAVNLGHSAAEFARDPDYYFRGYRNKLLSADTWKDAARSALQLDFRYITGLVARFARTGLLRMRR